MNAAELTAAAAQCVRHAEAWHGVKVTVENMGRFAFEVHPETLMRCKKHKALELGTAGTPYLLGINVRHSYTVPKDTLRLVLATDVKLSS